MRKANVNLLYQITNFRILILEVDMFCCHSLTNLIDNAGQRGLAVLICATDAGLRFALQMRSVSATDEATMAKNRQPSASLPDLGAAAARQKRS
jgi:hypothetical protein